MPLYLTQQQTGKGKLCEPSSLLGGLAIAGGGTLIEPGGF